MTNHAPFPELPGTARLWIHAADQPLEAPEEQALHERLDAFAATWTSHGRPVNSRAQVLHNRFLLVAAVISEGDISGCGIDKLAHVLDEAAEEMGFRWSSPLNVFYRDANGVPQRCSRTEFRTQAEAGTVTTQTPVFDLGITTLDDLRAGRFEQPAAESWHGRAFKLPQSA